MRQLGEKKFNKIGSYFKDALGFQPNNFAVTYVALIK